MNQVKLFKFLLLAMAAMSFIACEKNPVCIVMHDPVYPSNGQSVTYTCERLSLGGITSAKLYETVATVNSSGTITSAGTETLINSWSSPSGDLSYTKSSGYSSNRLVTYRFEVITADGTKNFRVTYAVRPYPVSDMPAPVYCQGDPDDVMDVVFIPDNDISNMSTFRTNVKGAIRESFFDETSLQVWRRQFNFYINPDRGTATDYDRISIDGLHQTPSNYANLSFAEGKVLMHQGNLRDYASGGLFSTEMQNRGTILHECGHALFGLADEYCGGSHWQATDFPNNWSSLAGAQAAAASNGKTNADARQMCATGWYKLCYDTCQMLTTGINHTSFDRPCKARIDYVILDNAIN